MLTLREISKFTGVPESTLSFWQHRGFLGEYDDMGEATRAIVHYLRNGSRYTKGRSKIDDCLAAIENGD